MSKTKRDMGLISIEESVTLHRAGRIGNGLCWAEWCRDR